MPHTCRACHATLTTPAALCGWHADTLATACRTYIELSPALLTRAAPYASDNTRTAKTTRDAAPAHLIDLKTELDTVFTTWANHYHHPTRNPLAAAQWIGEHAHTITARHGDAADMIDEITHTLTRLQRALKPTRPRATACPLCGGTTRPHPGGHQCATCHTTFTTSEAKAILKARAPQLWLNSPQLAAYVTLIAGTPTSPDAIRAHARRHHITRNDTGALNAAAYLATLDKPKRDR
ncbi:hypothetical protein H8R18_01240 [Nanchangia anserum]|uniref:Uncharacterized protein n=1 Tax=Nanchangia anserum TaxID=2692125 RepID=A0A8I0GFG3_9ACTO|nr:hypothetical protein [Nanchangia anserum]MBD3689862.1 hypothetical protein [Nanchangia anserum]QOX82029.1 hypothetical protein H8R18_01240 [Nanchangia anserum]